MKLSIITVCYNAPNLKETCESIINQKCQDFEWIVIDGGSNNETQKIWDKYKKRIDIFVSEKDSGIYNAMNKGICLAKGEYLLFMNAGDAFYDENSVINFINSGLTAPVIYGNSVYFDPEKNKSYRISYPKKINKVFWINDCICHQATFIKAELFKKFGLYLETYKSASDFEKWLCFYKNKVKFEKLNQWISVFYLGGFSNKALEISNKERSMIEKKYFSEKEIKNNKGKRVYYKILERFFSIKNSLDKKKKIITILNIHITIPYKRKEK